MDMKNDDSLKRQKNNFKSKQTNKKPKNLNKEKNKELSKEVQEEVNAKSKPKIKSKSIRKKKKTLKTTADDINDKYPLNLKNFNKNLKTIKEQKKINTLNIKNNKLIQNKLNKSRSRIKKIAKLPSVNNIEQQNNFYLTDFISTNEKDKDIEKSDTKTPKSKRTSTQRKNNINTEQINLINLGERSNSKEKTDQQKTLLDFINDTKSGIPMKVPDTERINNIHVYANSKEKSKKSSMTLSCSNLSEMMVNNLERETYKFLKPKVIIEADGSMRIEKPNYTEIAQKIQDENFKKNFPYIVHHNEKTKITSSSFRKTSHSDKWTEKETELFYKALGLFGCNFSYLEIVLKPRTREQIKKKFSREEKYNNDKIEEALLKNTNKSNISNSINKIYDKNNNISFNINNLEKTSENLTEEKSQLLKFANILKNYKNEKKKEEKIKGNRAKFSKYNHESEVTLSNYENEEIYDFYNNNKEGKGISNKINNNLLNEDVNDSKIKVKSKNNSGAAAVKNIENLYSKILIDEDKNHKNLNIQEDLNNLLKELDEKSNSDFESDDDSIQREKEKYKKLTASSRIKQRYQINSAQYESEEKSKLEENNSKKAIISAVNQRKESLNKKMESIIENNKEVKALIEANKDINSTQQVFDFLSNFK